MSERIGRYTIDSLLARGGMAEVFLAHTEGPAGFVKEVVIKRILPQFVEDPRFVKMFLDEAKLAAVLTHPNIVQVFDFGEENGSYFLTMEYIEGESLRNVVRHYQARGERIDPYMAAHLIVGACEGLHYAHSLCDKNGASYNIIHRDVSPDNILVSTSGITKVVDFGIAKAAVNQVKTETGVVKGKYAYMAPELIRGEGASRGVDVYAMGVTLYELLTGQRPFHGDNELSLLRDILKATPKTVAEVLPETPETISQIVANAMAPDRDERYPDTRSMQGALEDFLHERNPRIRALDVAELIKVVKEERKARTPGPASGPKGVPGFSPAGVAVPPTGATAQLPAAAPGAVPPPAPPQTIGSISVVTDPKKAAWHIPAALFGGLALVAAAVVFTRPTTSPQPQPAPVVAPVAKPPEPTPVAKTPDPTPIAKPPEPTPVAKPPEPTPVAKPPEPTPVAKLPVATPVAKPPEPTPKPLPTPTPKPLPAVVAKVELAAANSAPGLLTINSDPWCDVILDGKKVGTTPLLKQSVPAGRHQIQLRNGAMGARRDLVVFVKPGEETKEAVVFPMGKLAVLVSPWAKVSVDGTPVGSTPMEPVELAAGLHEIELSNPELKKVEKRRVNVRANTTETVKTIWE